MVLEVFIAQGIVMCVSSSNKNEINKLKCRIGLCVHFPGCPVFTIHDISLTDLDFGENCRC